MATQKDPTIFGYQNFYSSTLTGDITSGTLTIGLATVPTPTSGILIIEPDSTSSREVIFYTSKGASTITCPSDGRGWSGSSASAHLTGSTVIMASVDEYFEGLADGTLSADPVRTILPTLATCIVSGGTLAQSAGLVGTFSNIVFYLAGRRFSGSSIANKTYTASKDTYVDITGGSDGSITVTYTEVANNAASPALAANYIRVGIVTTSGAAITNVNQGDPDATLPTTTDSVPVAVCDTLGNLIYPKPGQRLLGFRRYPTGAGTSTTSTSAVAISAGLNIIVQSANVPANANVSATVTGRSWNTSSGNADVFIALSTATGTTIANTAAGTALIPLHASGSTRISANTTLVPAYVTTAGTVVIQAFNRSLTHRVELV